MRARARAVLALTLAAAAAGCGGAPAGHRSATAGSRSAAGPTTPVPVIGTPHDWPMYHGDPQRSGVATGLPAAAGLGPAWTARLDGAVYGQPLVVGGSVIAATENNSVYGLDPRDGHVLWRRHLGTPMSRAQLPCGNIDPLGITSTAVYDRRSRLVFVVGERRGHRFVLTGIRPATGHVAFSRDVAPPGGHPANQQQRAALAVTAGRVYVAFGGLFGDCGSYSGSVVAVPTDGKGKTLSYRVPGDRGAIWAPAGPVLTGDGRLLVATGNTTARPSQPWDGGDSVLALDPELRLRGYFAPSSWARDNVTDADLGSMSPAVVSAAGRTLIAGKNGTAYLLRTDRLGGVGSAIASAPICMGFGGAAVQGRTVYLPCVTGGIASVRVGADTISTNWRGPQGANGPPVVGGGAVWSVGWPAGHLYELDPATGAQRARIDVGPVPHFTTPTLTANLALIPTTTGITAITTSRRS